MKLLALDVETGGLDPKKHSLLEAAFVKQEDDGSRQTLRFLFPNHNGYRVQAFAARMHGENGLWNELILYSTDDYFARQVTNELCICTPDSALVVDKVKEFLGGIPKHYTLIGKNVTGFDLPFLYEQSDFDRGFFRHRAIDVGTLFLRPNDSLVPDLKECLTRAGMKGTVLHRATDDAVACLDLYNYWQINQWRAI